jgi:cilia- and flagella-associated protein 44
MSGNASCFADHPRWLQMLKFGREIDMSLLDRLGPASGADEMQKQLQQQEQQFAVELREWDRKIAARTEELMGLTQESTAHLQTVAELSSQQKSLELNIQRTQQTLQSDTVALRRREAAERDHLVQMVNTQATEIDYLKTQIQLLQRKDTSVYS